MPMVDDPDAPPAPVPAQAASESSCPLAAHAQAAQGGDRAATQALIARIQPGVRRLARALVGQPQDAEEVVQESLMKVAHSIKGYRGQARVSTWVHRIVVNTALMRLRGQGRRPWDAVRAFGPTAQMEVGDASPWLGGRSMGRADAWAPRPDQEAQSRQTRARIEDAAACLPERYRAVFVLRDVEGHSNEEVAEMLGLTVPTVKTRLHRARGFMRHALAPELDPGPC